MSNLGNHTSTLNGSVFIVGASRSGTAMLRSCLNSHSEVHLASETHYFDDLRTRRDIVGKKVLSRSELEYCADYFRALDDRPYGMKGDPHNSSISQFDLLEAADHLGRDADAVFEAYCQLKAYRSGAKIWGEKTPRHVFRIDDILERFPQTRIICMVRDPRAVVASYRDWKNQGGLKRAIGNTDYQDAIKEEEQRAKLSYNIVISTLLWRAAAKASIAAKRKFGSKSIKIVRYEDVVSKPELELMEICTWLGIQYESGMMDIPMLNSSFSKFSNRSGITGEASERWRNTLSTNEIGVIQKVAGNTLSIVGYSPVPVGSAIFSVVAECFRLPYSVILAAYANRNRMGNFVSYFWRRVRAVVGM
ncbi:MAG: sulfotransferase [Pseudomonadota bacterium]